MKSNKPATMKEARIAAGLTLEQVAAEVKISYSAARAIEIGIGRNYPAATKHRISDLLGVPFFDMFPEERDRLEGLIEEIRKSDHRLAMLKDYLPEIRFRKDAAARAVLNAATLDELDEIFHSGVTAEEAVEALGALAKKCGLSAPQIKTTK
jgi:transcriptional regulator with XRE-family HTH domain